VNQDDIFSQPVGRWMEGTGPSADVVISSRVRLARNVAGVPFPHAMEREAALRLIQSVQDVVEAAAHAGDAEAGGGAPSPLRGLHLVRLGDLGPLQRQALVEKHLISPQHARNPLGAVAIRADQAVSVMVNEEDHLRIQALYPALQLHEALALCSAVDDELEAHLDYAWHQRFGYLTACPTNTGTAMRASVMLHLPGLVMTNQARRLTGLISKLNCVVRGMYGEGSEAAGNVFQVSNQVTMGQSEEDVLTGLISLTTRLVQEEREARAGLLAEMRTHLEDRVWRAWGVLTCARVLTSKEALACVSDLRLGVDLDIIRGLDPRRLNGIMFAIRPAHVQILTGRELDPDERDIRRASIVRQQIAGAPIVPAKAPRAAEGTAGGAEDPAQGGNHER
jgi:protein arginine kinase